MPTEIRKIIFAEDEIVRAILTQNHNSTKKLPPGDIVEVKANSSPEPSLELTIFDPTAEDPKTINLRAPYLAAAMLRFCFDNKIPIPRIADKSVEVLGSSLALSISINANTTAFEA